MRPDLTVIYYTANRETSEFEAKIQQALLEAIGDCPLISVSQQPIAFGKNICVGDVGASGHNAIRQFQIGAQEATTRFVCSAESDFLYPPERFGFQPERDDVLYGVTNWYVILARNGVAPYAMKKRGSLAFGPITCGREFLIRQVDRYLNMIGPYWSTTTARSRHPRNFYAGVSLEPLPTKVPLITFKTDENMHCITGWLNSGHLDHIPSWGSVQDLVAKYLRSENV